MRYVKFEIQNFKGIKALTLDLLTGPAFRATTLVGLNESGKTTILEAINLIQKDLPEELRYQLIPRNNQHGFTGDISVVAVLDLDAEDNRHIKKHALEINDLVVIKDVDTLKIKKTYRFNRGKFQPPSKIEYEIVLVGKSRRAKKESPEKHILPTDYKYESVVDFISHKLLPPIIYYPNFLADFPRKIYLKPLPNELPGQSEYRRVIQDILDSIDDKNLGLTVEEDIVRRIESGAEEDKSALESLENSISEKITGDVFGAWRKILKPQDEDSLSDKKIVVKHDIEKIPDTSGVEQPIPYLTIKVKEGPESYDIAERSLGFRWFFSYFLFTEFRKHRSSDMGEILFLIDEPASNLHSTAQLKLLETFQELVKKSRLVYTTHSHHLINADWLEGAYIVQNKSLDYDKELSYNSSRTDIDALPYRQFAANHPNQQTYFQPILDKLDYRPSLLENVPDMVIVEGKNDFYTLQYANKVFFGEKYDKLHLCPGNGAGKNGTVIQYYIAWGRNFIVLCDADSAGIAAKEKYLKDFGKIMENRVFTLEDISGAFKGKVMEDVFSSDAEKLRVVQEFFLNQKTFSKDKLNQAIQNLLFLKQPVKKINKKTLENLEKILVFLDTKLFPYTE